MSRICAICGKGRTSGNNVSHSKLRTRRTWGANVQKTSLEIDGNVRSAYVCTKCMKTAKKSAE